MSQHGIAKLFHELWQRLPTQKVELRINSLSGNVTLIDALRTWTVQEVKKAIECQSGILQREQILLLERSTLADGEVLDACFPSKHVIDLTLVRRPPLVAEWLEKAITQPGDVRSAPEEILRHREIMLTAAEQDYSVLEHVHPDLWADREFVQKVVQWNWRCFTKASRELQKDRDIIIGMLQNHMRALRCVPVEMRNDPEIILASIPQFRYPTHKIPGAIDSLMTDHTYFVFQHAAEGLRYDIEFMRSAIEKCYHTAEFAPPEMWKDRDFVLCAVKSHGQLLKKAAPEFQADPEIVHAAVQQNGLALQHALNGLDTDCTFAPGGRNDNSHALDFVGMALQEDWFVTLVTLIQRLHTRTFQILKRCVQALFYVADRW